MWLEKNKKGGIVKVRRIIDGVVFEAIQIKKETIGELRDWLGSNFIAPPPIKPTPENPSGVYWQILTTPRTPVSAFMFDWVLKKDDQIVVVSTKVFDDKYEVSP